MADGSVQPVHHILKDGADSIGTAGASLRVYVNIGMCSDYWTTLHDNIYGVARQQEPFRIALARKDCADWRATEARMENAEAFLKTIPPALLKDAPGGAQYLTSDQAVLARGARAFAETCARCHSSKQPPPEITNPADRIAWFREAVLKPDFLENNFLSDDRRYSVAELGTNMSRALASNATQGHVWEEFSSATYKQQPPVGKITGLYNPVKPSRPLDFTPPGGGLGYYRVPTLAGIWATAPFFHNNALGLYNADPSVAGRMAAFNDAMEKLLWPENRLGVQSMWITDVPSELPLSSGYRLKVVQGTPVKLLASINTPQLNTLRNDNFFTRFLGWLIGRGRLRNTLLKRNLSPDFIEDRGHTFANDLSDDDKRALIEYVKTF